MQVGTATAEPGTEATGYRTVTELPTGQPERVPVCIVNGAEPGPTLWVTGTIHGDEPTGGIAIHEALSRVRADSLAGRLVCVPGMNPAGIRTNSRTSYYHGDDPNRHFGRGADSARRTPRVQQRINDRLYEDIAATADAVVPLHTSWVATHPYTIQPRVPYGTDRSRSAAVELRDRLTDLTAAFGLPVVNEFTEPESEHREIHHTLTGTAMADGIPAFTPELGGRFVVEQDVCAAAVEGVWNVLHALDMVAEPASSAPTFSLGDGEQLKRVVHPHADAAGLVKYRVTEGDAIEAGQVVADVRTPHGERKSAVVSEYSGYVLSRHEGAAAFEGDPLLDLAVPDDDPLLVRTSGANSGN